MRVLPYMVAIAFGPWNGAGLGAQAPEPPPSSAIVPPALLETLPSSGLYVEMRGLQYRDAEAQGRMPGQPEPGLYSERLVIGPGGTALAWEVRHERSDGTVEWLREIHEGPDRVTFVVFELGHAFRSRPADAVEERAQILRRLPGTVEAPGDPVWAGRRMRIEAVSQGLLRSAAFDEAMPLLGEREIRWSFGPAVAVAGSQARVYSGWTIHVGDRPFVDVRLAEARPATDDDLEALRPPDGFATGDFPEQPSPPALPGSAAAGARIDTLRAGVFRVRNLRGGFHPLVVDLGDRVVLADAPAGYPLLTRLPATDVAPGPDPAWLSRRFLELAGEVAGGKPIAAVVVSHVHGDHAGGLTAFADAGVPALVADPHAATLRERMPGLEVRGVRGQMRMTGPSRSVDVVDVGPNPHADHLLVMRLADGGELWVSDLLDATPLERFPSPGRAALDRWFSGWLAARGWTPPVVWTMHGTGEATPEHLDRLGRRPGPGG